MRLNSGPTGSHRTVHRRYTEGRHPGAPFFARTMGTGHTRAAWVGEVSPGATTAVPLPPVTWPGSTHNLRRESARRSNQTSKQSQPHTDTPTLAALRSAGTVRHASRAKARFTHTTKEARGWAIGGRHGQMCARMCGLPHFPHDAQIPDQNFTMLLSLRRFHIVLVFCIYIPDDRDVVLTG